MIYYFLTFEIIILLLLYLARKFEHTHLIFYKKQIKITFNMHVVGDKNVNLIDQLNEKHSKIM